MANDAHMFVPVDAAVLAQELTALFEQLFGAAVQPASPERLFIQWMANTILQERVLTNYAGDQNIPSRAEGENLDALGELFFEQFRPPAAPAHCTMRFYISAPLSFPVLVPAGTAVTDLDKQLYWKTDRDLYIPAGDIFADTSVTCQTPGKIGNGYLPGQISNIVDIYNYFSRCENITTSDGGSDRASDAEYRALLRLSMDGYSTAGSQGSYIYHAKKVSTEIADVVANSPAPGEVYIYVLMSGGVPASEEIKAAVLAACNDDKVRPFTDHVHMGDPQIMPYHIDLTYFVYENSVKSSAEIQRDVDAAVSNYIRWQCERLGRDINPSKLYQLIMATGVKRVEIRSPVFTSLQDGKLAMSEGVPLADTVPQIAQIGTVSVINGGFENE